jgi:ribose transport system ATP-binding protein
LKESKKSNSTPLLEMVKINKSFPGVRALTDVDFDLRSGEVHALVGENGAGKSTLVKILSGALQTDSGRIIMKGRVIPIKSPRMAQNQGICIIYQELNLIPHLSAAANISLGCEPVTAGLIRLKEMKQRAARLLQDLGIDIDVSIPVKFFSVAQQQMVEIAKALISHSKILIMDEPTSALTTGEINTLFSTIKKLKERGTGIIYISHRLEELFDIADRVTVLRDGRSVGTAPIREMDKAKLIHLMADRDLKEYYPRIRSKPGETILEIRNLSSGQKLKNVSFTLKQGEILGIAGLLGAGRTELARLIFGLENPDEGQIFRNGQESKIISPRQAIKAGIGFLTEDRKQSGLVLQLSVADNISLPNYDRFSRLGWIKRRALKSLADKFVKELRIKTPATDQKVFYLSGGNQQKVVLSKWIARQPDILIFDEPTRGIDVASKVEIYELMNQLTARGVGIIMISSELPEIIGMSDRILVMYQGKISAEFDAREATQQKILAKALGEVA